MNEAHLSVTVDLEDWYHLPSVCGSPFSVYSDVNDFFKQRPQHYDYLNEPTRIVLDLLEEFHVTATFFVVADVIEHYPGLVEAVVKRGHEIGCHGLHHSCKIHPRTKQALMSRTEFEERTFQAKEMLEAVSGEKVLGYRAPNVMVAGWMLDSLEKLDFQYDSSVCVNSLYNKTDSDLKGVTSVPYYPVKNGLEPGEERDFVEFPWAYLEALGWKLPTSGGPVLRFLGAAVIAKGLEQSLRRGHTVFYFHPLDISNEKFPRIGRGRPMYWSIKGKVVEKRIRAILKKFRHVNMVSLRDALKKMKVIQCSKNI